MGIATVERTGGGKVRLSKWHRAWGWDCPALGIQRLMLEYDRGKAAALVEYRHERTPRLRLSHPSVRAIGDLADRAGIPAFIVRYADDFSWWYPTPLNVRGRALFPKRRHLTEEEWVELLYRCRGRGLPLDRRQRA